MVYPPPTEIVHSIQIVRAYPRVSYMAAVMDHGELEAIEMSELVNGEEHP